MKPSESLVLVGGSVRAAAFSALRAGLRPWCADLFADADLQQRCPSLQIPAARYPQDLPKLLAQAPPGPWLFTGALENRRDLIRQLATLRPLWSNDATVLKQTRSPFAVRALLAERGLPCPKVRRGGTQGTDGSWLLKPLGGAGGRGIIPWTPQTPKPPRVQRWYLQEFVAGLSCAAVYVGDTRRAQLLGVTQQLVGESWLHAAPFHYCGSVGPLSLTVEVRERFARLGDILVEGFSLRGLFGVDCVLKDGVPWPVEINPRYTASVEVLEYATGLSALALHQRVFEPDTAPSAAPPPLQPSVVGKVIFYTPTTFAFPQEGPWLETLQQPHNITTLPAYADIPGPGQQLLAGWPVLTCFAQAASADICLEILQQKVKALDRWLFGS